MTTNDDGPNQTAPARLTHCLWCDGELIQTPDFNSGGVTHCGACGERSPVQVRLRPCAEYCCHTIRCADCEYCNLARQGGTAISAALARAERAGFRLGVAGFDGFKTED